MLCILFARVFQNMPGNVFYNTHSHSGVAMVSASEGQPPLHPAHPQARVHCSIRSIMQTSLKTVCSRSRAQYSKTRHWGSSTTTQAHTGDGIVQRSVKNNWLLQVCSHPICPSLSSCGNCKVIAHRLSTVKDADLIVAQLQTALSKNGEYSQINDF